MATSQRKIQIKNANSDLLFPRVRTIDLVASKAGTDAATAYASNVTQVFDSTTQTVKPEFLPGYLAQIEVKDVIELSGKGTSLPGIQEGKYFANTNTKKIFFCSGGSWVEYADFSKDKLYLIEENGTPKAYKYNGASLNQIGTDIVSTTSVRTTGADDNAVPTEAAVAAAVNAASAAAVLEAKSAFNSAMGASAGVQTITAQPGITGGGAGIVTIGLDTASTGKLGGVETVASVSASVATAKAAYTVPTAGAVAAAISAVDAKIPANIVNAVNGDGVISAGTEAGLVTVSLKYGTAPANGVALKSTASGLIASGIVADGTIGTIGTVAAVNSISSGMTNGSTYVVPTMQAVANLSSTLAASITAAGNTTALKTELQTSITKASSALNGSVTTLTGTVTANSSALNAAIGTASGALDTKITAEHTSLITSYLAFSYID